MAKFIGRSGSLLLFTEEDRGVVIDSDVNLIIASGQAQALQASRSWAPGDYDSSSVELAEMGLFSVDISITAGGSRLYTIPKAAQAEAKKALEWRKEHKRGGTDVGLNTARTLAKGGQIGLEKVRHISKYFARHEVDKKGKGWKPGEDGFPSNGRIAWALWGGDAAWRWARAIVERENKKAVTADGYGIVDGKYNYGYPTAPYELDDFESAHMSDDPETPEFLVRVRLDGSGIDRLYKIDLDRNVYVWDDGIWDNLGQGGSNIWFYDAELDDVEDAHVEKSHIVVDPESAVIVAARLMNDPGCFVTVDQIDAVEAGLVVDALEAIDWELIDRGMTAAGEINPDDGVYTPEERAANAAQQVRDASGKFARTGSRVVVNGDIENGLGNISKVSPSTGTVDVLLDNGQTVTVPGAQVSDAPTETTPGYGQGDLVETPSIDTSGILGEPRTPINRKVGQIPGTLPAMTDADLHSMLADWPAWVRDQRSAFRAAPSVSPVNVQQKDSLDIGDWGRGLEAETGKTLIKDAYDHPLINKWLNKQDRAGKYPNKLWYNPITAAADGDVAKAVNPETTDVQPIYMALVDAEDPRAVLNLVSLVPASDQSNDPMIYKRSDGKWVRDPKILQDLQSATPPPVVPLDSETLQDVLKQVDESQSITASLVLSVLFEPTLTAAGGLDRNRGKAEELRKYWTRGRGALKIRWGTPGDWTRCVRNLRKYMGPRAKGYCALRHKEMNGMWPGEHNKKNFSFEEGVKVYSSQYLRSEDEIIQASILNGRRSEVIERFVSSADSASLVASAAIGEDKNVRTSSVFNYAKVGMPFGAKSYIKDNKADEETEVSLEELIPTQKTINMSRVADVMESDKPIEVWSDAEGMKIIDGHHRAAGAKLSGRKTINANIYKHEEVNPETEEESDETPLGAKFVIPLVIPEGVESGDGRIFKKGAITVRELPLPLLWQIKTGAGHDGSVVVGRIDHMERTDQGIGNAYGHFDTGAYGREAERLVREGFIRGVSADMDQFEAQESEEEITAAEDSDEKSKKIKKDKITINKARVMAVTIVPKPAFQECSISLASEEGEISQEETMIPDGIYIEDVDPTDAEAIVASGIIAGAIPVEPPKDWFTNPGLKEPTPLTVTDDGRVFGHIAAWHVDHIGMAFGTRPPRSRSNYGYFHTGVCRTAEGVDIPVGQLTLAGGHASIEASAAEAVKHYDDTASAIADIHAGEDQYGIWVSGALRPGTTPEQIRALRASAPSGDWRPIKGSLELVAICQVNVPGFPIARARVASGQVMALVAAGAHALAKMRHNPIDELSKRLDNLERPQKEALLAAAEEAKARFESMRPVTADAYGFVESNETGGETDLVAMLDQLLADSVAFSFKSQGYHWNVKGPNFAEYHELFGAIYADVYGTVDPIAENMLKLGYDAPFNLGQWASQNSIGNGGVAEASCQAMAYDLYVASEQLVAELQAAFDVANSVNEQGIADYIAARIDAQQKWSWQLRASSAGYSPTEKDVPEGDAYEMAFSALQESGTPEAALIASAENLEERIESFFAVAEFAKFTKEEREKLADKGQALSDGSFPIRNEADLKNAIRAYGRSNKEDRAKVRKHIIKRARALGASKLIPENWGVTASAAELTVDDMREKIARASEFASDPVRQLRARVASAKGELDKALEEARKSGNQEAVRQAEEDIRELEKSDQTPFVPGELERDEFGRVKFTAKTQPRDAQGRFRLVLARLKSNLGTSGNQAVIAKIKEAENLDNTGDYAAAVEAVADLINTVDRLDTGALNKESLENITRTTTDLGKVIANLPLPFANQAQKVRYSDLPPALQELVENMITKVEEKIGKEDADVATQELRGFMSGSDVYSQGEVSSQMNKLLRLLT